MLAFDIGTNPDANIHRLYLPRVSSVFGARVRLAPGSRLIAVQSSGRSAKIKIMDRLWARGSSQFELSSWLDVLSRPDDIIWLGSTDSARFAGVGTRGDRSWLISTQEPDSACCEALLGTARVPFWLVARLGAGDTAWLFRGSAFGSCLNWSGSKLGSPLGSGLGSTGLGSGSDLGLCSSLFSLGSARGSTQGWFSSGLGLALGLA